MMVRCCNDKHNRRRLIYESYLDGGVTLVLLLCLAGLVSILCPYDTISVLLGSVIGYWHTG